MQTKNIAALTAMLHRSGFDEGIGYRLLQRICFNPAVFMLTEKIQKNHDTLTCSLRFERSGTDYTCPYYDIALLKGISMPLMTINGIDLQELETGMKKNDWQLRDHAADFRLDHEASWNRERQIAETVADLNRLAATAEGKYFADMLKLQYWSDCGLEELIGNLQAVRSKFEISQRVYFIDGEGISVDEAYRFLLNRWMEKKMQAQKREHNSEAARDTMSSDTSVMGKGLLQKKRSTKGKRIK